ncbi:ExeA family protein [Catenovulum adriaticum]|uniref:AAA family ATPase n=1 Tax=Catenovulum adriaticum TaxID=2984846 RepID=A0ABY7ALD4_9ALTE|nr:AAA family ATPase [Catenovulum sp. TS8]WAJ69131.1 AAA family ATPase [Catenovulum sp. TS8]
MYQSFFGLKDIPFSIAPNPDYLYMSERHKEALAHLSFGLHETGGFVLLTGEVGTGKTTVSRCLLAQIPEQTQVAFILNPTLTEHELLATICDEFKIPYNKTQSSIKDLTDAIKAYLLDNHQSGKSALLIIDEAQHLKAQVLEQLRLLTNLETNTKKLLQVILIGQPELQALLKRQELRQLAQRITARYHLLPLNQSQVSSYINHRLQVAGCQQALFTKTAVKRIHQISQGIPRVINLLCDRALMGAYVKQQDRVDVKVVEQAATEALDYEFKKVGLTEYKKPGLILAGIFVMATLGAAYLFLFADHSSPVAIPKKDGQEVQITLPENAKPKQINLPAQSVLTSLTAENEHLVQAFSRLAQLWHLPENQAWQSPCVDVVDYDLACYQFSGSFNQLTNLNTPALLEFYQSDGQVFYGVLTVLNDQFIVRFSNETLTLELDWLEQAWRGKALLLWHPPANLSLEQTVLKIDSNSKLTQLQWLDNQLSVLLAKPRKKVERFDTQLQAKLNQFQNKHKLALTPFADTQTLILIQQLTSATAPKLHEGK